MIRNAIKYTPIKGVIEVKISSEKEFVTIVVNDNGIGIPSEELPHIFDRFYRSDASRSLPGSGLGLAIVRQVAQSHSAEAAVENAEGGGARLSVSFPPAP